MSGQLFDRYGAIVDEDVDVLETCLYAGIVNDVPFATRRSKLSILEIGMHDGGTARGIEQFLAARGATLDYMGIDVDEGNTRPRYVPVNGRVIIGDSIEVHESVDGPFDLIWVDGCHCVNHIVLETLHYAPKVRVGGFMCFHDANPKGQGVCHQYHGPNTPDFGLGITKAHTLINWPHVGWEKFAEGYPTDRHDCGTIAYRRTA